MDHQDEQRPVRIAIRLEVEYWVESVPFRAEISDLGESGAFLDTPNPFQPGTGFTYKFCMPGDTQAIEGHARVVWQQQMVGMGVQFDGPSEEYRQRFKSLEASEIAF